MRIQRARAKIWLGRSLRQVVAAALLSVGVLFCLPGILIRGDPLYQGSEVVESLPPSGDAASGGVQAASRDRGRAVRLQMDDGTIRELSMADYLWGVVAAEMPASFELEALKAQACAARTYTVVRQNSGSDKHPGADICEDSTCCQAYIEREAALARWGLNAQEYEEKISQAVEGTDGLGILYNGEPIQALFFSSAAGQTVDAVEVWGNSVDYLKSVDSPEGEEVPNYHSQVVLTAQQTDDTVTWRSGGAHVTDDPTVRSLLEDLTALSFSRCVDYNPSDEAVTICGLDQPEAAVRLNYLTDSGTEAELGLSVGDRLPDRSGRYAQLEDDTTIYLLETALLDPLMRVAASGLEG